MIQVRSTQMNGDSNEKVEEPGSVRPAIPAVGHTSLADWDLFFNPRGKLVRKSDGRSWKDYYANVKTDITNAVVQEIYRKMEEEQGMKRLPLKTPHDRRNDACYGFVFASEGWETKEAVVVLVHGKGATRAGMWSIHSAMNDSLEKGSMLPYIGRVKEKNWGVLVLNPFCVDYSIKREGVELTNKDKTSLHMLHAYAEYLVHFRGYIHFVANRSGGNLLQGMLERIVTFKAYFNIRTVCLIDSNATIPTIHVDFRPRRPHVVRWSNGRFDPHRHIIYGSHMLLHAPNEVIESVLFTLETVTLFPTLSLTDLAKMAEEPLPINQREPQILVIQVSRVTLDSPAPAEADTQSAVKFAMGTDDDHQTAEESRRHISPAPDQKLQPSFSTPLNWTP